MILFKKITELRNWLDHQHKEGRKTGFVPTMGALHDGHVSLISTSKTENEVTVCSIFVNPAQFNDHTDFDKYPVTIEKDIDKLEEAGCDVLFLPSVKEVYPDGADQSGHYDLGYLETVLEGQYRPGHFQGVCKVVQRLLEIIGPCELYLGQKDYQQCMVIKRMIETTGLSKTVRIHISPTVREQGGLAMSSRNMRLNEQQLKQAKTISAVLSEITSSIRPGKINSLKEKARNELVQAGFKPDYVEIAKANDLTIIDHWDGKQKLVALVAAYLGDVRLIDNKLIDAHAT